MACDYTVSNQANCATSAYRCAEALLCLFAVLDALDQIVKELLVHFAKSTKAGTHQKKEGEMDKTALEFRLQALALRAPAYLRMCKAKPLCAGTLRPITLHVR
jgi:hypothetical protein